MISLIGNRPALQIGRHQVIDYDTACLSDALRRAAQAAEREDFPFVEDIRSGIVQYLETKCPLRLLPIADLFERMRKMLLKIGFESIDGRPATIVALLVIPRREKLLHIRTLAEVARLLSRDEVRSRLLGSGTPEEVLSALREEEARDASPR